ncbi:hypothetical protein GALL_488460 [mine drainage metagenome]|uniref:Uncharacterized protein n=1 Tax=mine drainage metagenome TaxID=410659 RepID=A0A1J5PP50_9ZZZZ
MVRDNIKKAGQIQVNLAAQHANHSPVGITNRHGHAKFRVVNRLGVVRLAHRGCSTFDGAGDIVTLQVIPAHARTARSFNHYRPIGSQDINTSVERTLKNHLRVKQRLESGGLYQQSRADLAGHLRQGLKTFIKLVVDMLRQHVGRSKLLLA